jgi:hypothetical protein
MSIPLRSIIETFAFKWGPKEEAPYHEFIDDLRLLVETYGRAALAHQSLPDTEHEHGAPV